MKKFFDIMYLPEALLFMTMIVPFTNWNLIFPNVPKIHVIIAVIRVLSALYVVSYVMYNGGKAGEAREAAEKRAKEQRDRQLKEEFERDYISFRAEMAQRMQRHYEQEER